MRGNANASWFAPRERLWLKCNTRNHLTLFTRFPVTKVYGHRKMNDSIAHCAGNLVWDEVGYGKIENPRRRTGGFFGVFINGRICRGTASYSWARIRRGLARMGVGDIWLLQRNHSGGDGRQFPAKPAAHSPRGVDLRTSVLVHNAEE